MNGVELSEMKGRGYSPNVAPPADGRNTRTNSSLAVAFEELRARMNTKKLADDSRRVTRKSKGLDPNVPRPKEERTKFANIQTCLPRTSGRSKTNGQRTKLVQFSRWTNIAFPFQSCAIGSAPALK